MMKHSRILLVSVVALATIVFAGCPDPRDGFEPTYDPGWDYAVRPVGPYVDVLSGEIRNVSVRMEYSLDGGSTWSDCPGSVVSFSAVEGQHILIRDGDDEAWERDLGTVDSLSVDFDVHPTNRLRTFVVDGSQNWWDDTVGFVLGDQITFEFFFENYGSTWSNPPGATTQEDTSDDTFAVDIYLSTDTTIDSSTDILLSRKYYPYTIWHQNNEYDYHNVYWVSNFTDEMYLTQDGTDTGEDLAPGTYYVGAIVDADDVMAEANEGNNATSPDDVTRIIVVDDEETYAADGAFKIVNSWGEGGWENNDVDSPGAYWMPYEVMITNKMEIVYYHNNFDIIYTPRLLAVFEIDHPRRDEILVTFGLGSPEDPVAEKRFDFTWDRSIDWGDGEVQTVHSSGGDEPFPNNAMVLDITELAPWMNDFELYMEVENVGPTEATVESSVLELYNGTSAGAFKTIDIVDDDTAAPADSQSVFASGSIGSLSAAELADVTPAVQSSRVAVNTSGTTFVEEEPSSGELSYYMDLYGVAEEGRNYNIPWNGYSTGLRPPSEAEWESLLMLRSIDPVESSSRASFDGSTLPDEVDNSASIHFPPIGSQGGEGSCASFAVGYYVATYTEAREHGWDFTGTEWGSDPYGLSDGGAPTDDLDRIFSPDFLYHQINGGSDSGSSIVTGTTLVIRNGIATWQEMPYDTRDHTSWPSEAAWREAPLYRAAAVDALSTEQSGFFTIEDMGDVQMLKTLLAEGYVVSTAVRTQSVGSNPGLYDHLDDNDVVDGPTFARPADDPGMAVDWVGEGYPIDHAQTIVGYKEGTAWNPADPDS